VSSRRTGRHRCVAVTPDDALATDDLTRREYRALVHHGPGHVPEQRTSPRRLRREHLRRRRRQHLLGRVAPTLATAALVLGTGTVVASQQTGLAAGSAEAALPPTQVVSSGSGGQPVRVDVAAPDPRAQGASRSQARPALAVVTAVATDLTAARSELHAGVRAHAAVAATTASTAAATSEALDEARWRESFHPPITDASVTSDYGPRWGRMHQGIDFGAQTGHPLHAVADAVVTTAGYNSGLGYHVRLTLTDGTVVSYGHLSRVLVERGQRVDAGDIVGRVGSSGLSTGAHLHLEVWQDGEPVDPRPWLVERGLL
jgi:murein DD-endopeptidase MepM/ murein hydrolase activator NlpD